MNGSRPLFLEGVELGDRYYSAPDPYSDDPGSDVNLLELSRYARKAGKKLNELTAEEVKAFKNDN